MCTRPITKDGNTFACRSCDACIATRRAGWIARAMMEKAEWPHTLCVALTYSDDTQENRDAAKMFAYADVRAFLKRLAAACQYKEPGARLRFICAGEQGDRNGRCHWHLILYSDLDLTQIGTYKRHGKALTDRAEMISQGKNKIRLQWSTWGKGFVTLQEPDEGGMAYVLSYCLKDQFTAQKSQGTMREAKSENFATGLFRMSKRPAIGESWLMRKMESLEAQGAVLPSLQIKIPSMSGYWHPNGSFREKVLWSLVALNQRIYWATGANAPQWAALRASCQDNPSDMEILDAFQKRQKPEETVDDRIKRRRGDSQRIRQDHSHRTKCGRLVPCIDCLNAFDSERLASLGIRRQQEDFGGGFSSPRYYAEGYQGAEAASVFDEWRESPLGYINPDCQKLGENQSRDFAKVFGAG